MEFRKLKYIFILYLLGSLFSSYIQYLYIENSYKAIEKVVEWELSHNKVSVGESKSINKTLKYVIQKKIEGLSFIFFSSLWNFIILISLLFIFYITLSFYKILKDYKGLR